MLSVLGKLITSELGENRYYIYFTSYRKWLKNQSTENKKKKNEEIFNDIYQELKDKDITTLQRMLERLLETIYLSMKISKQFMFVFVFYCITLLGLLSLDLVLGVTIVGIFLATISFIYKTYEYILNRYCYIDAHIILVYKTVLYHLILTHDLKKVV